MPSNKHPSEWAEDEFIAAVLREHPGLKIDYLPDGTRVIRGIKLKREAEKLLISGRRLLREKPTDDQGLQYFLVVVEDQLEKEWDVRTNGSSRCHNDPDKGGSRGIQNAISASWFRRFSSWS